MKNFLKELRKRPFKMSEDSLWNAGQFVFYFDRPQTEDDLYGIPRGNVHGQASHAHKHAREFMTQEQKEDFIARAKKAIEDRGITHVWQGKGSKRDQTASIQVADLNLPRDQWEKKRGLLGLKKIPVSQMNKKHIFNGLAWISTKKTLGRKLSADEEWFYQFSQELQDIYTDRMNDFSMKQYFAVVVADENFSSKEELFEKLKDLYLNSKEIRFEMTRDDGPYRVTFNLATFVYTSIKLTTGEKGTFFRFENKRRKRTLRVALIKWASTQTSSINDDYSYLRELCNHALKPGPLPEWGEWGILERYDKQGEPTGAPIPHKEEMNEVKTLRNYIRQILEESKRQKKRVYGHKVGFKIKDKMGKELKLPAKYSKVPPEFEHPQGLSGVIKRKEVTPTKGIMYYNLVIGGQTFEGEFSGYGYAARGVDDFGPFSMRLKQEHPDIPMPMHEPQIVFSWVNGDLKIYDV